MHGVGEYLVSLWDKGFGEEISYVIDVWDMVELNSLGVEMKMKVMVFYVNMFAFLRFPSM